MVPAARKGTGGAPALSPPGRPEQSPRTTVPGGGHGPFPGDPNLRAAPSAAGASGFPGLFQVSLIPDRARPVKFTGEEGGRAFRTAAVRRESFSREVPVRWQGKGASRASVAGHAPGGHPRGPHPYPWLGLSLQGLRPGGPRPLSGSVAQGLQRRVLDPCLPAPAIPRSVLLCPNFLAWGPGGPHPQSLSSDGFGHRALPLPQRFRQTGKTGRPHPTR